MKREIEQWTAEDLYKRRDLIQYPEYQREPTVWGEKRSLLIDSMLIELDIPKIFLFKPEGADYYDCVDGQQRIVSVLQFFDGQIGLPDGRKWDNLSLSEQKTISKYVFTIAVITEASDEELRLLFLRLQLGAPLNAGEKLHAMKGDMRDFVFDLGKNHPFFKKVRIVERRFAKETVFAQICINSFYLSLNNSFYGARYNDLYAFFDQYPSLSKFQEQIRLVKYTLDKLDSNFGDNAAELTNRAVIVSAYLFFEELIRTRQEEKLPIFAEFYLSFLAKLTEETEKGLDYDPEYRELLDFQTYIIQAAVAKRSIETRHAMLKEYFDYYLSKREIKTTSIN